MNLFKNISEKDPEWSETYSDLPKTTHPLLSLLMKLTLLPPKGTTPRRELIEKSKEYLLNYLRKWMVSTSLLMLKLSWPLIDMIPLTLLYLGQADLIEKLNSLTRTEDKKEAFSKLSLLK